MADDTESGTKTRKKITTVRVEAQGNIDLRVIKRLGGIVPFFAFERLGGAVLPKGMKIWVFSDVAEKLKKIKILGSSLTDFREQIPAFTSA